MAATRTIRTVLGKKLVAIDPSAEELLKDFESGVWDGMQKDMDQRKLDDDGSGLTRSHASAAFGYMLVRKHHIQTSAERPVVRARQQNIEELLPKW